MLLFYQHFPNIVENLFFIKKNKMKISRRKFLLNSGAAAFSAAIILPGQNIFGQTAINEQAYAIPPESTNDALNYLRREHFESVVNTFFQFQTEEGRNLKLQLLAIENLRREENDQQGFGGESFSLLFEGTKKSKIAQGNYQVSHDTLGQFMLFIVPVGLRGNRYEAIINRINV
jgi:hypothetical protein